VHDSAVSDQPAVLVRRSAWALQAEGTHFALPCKHDLGVLGLFKVTIKDPSLPMVTASLCFQLYIDEL